MEEIRKIARAYYKRASEEEKTSVAEFFTEFDLNGDGKVSFQEFKISASETLSHEWLPEHDHIFRQLDSNKDGSLDFDDVLALYYIFEKEWIIPKCDGCDDLLAGPYFSCLSCLENGGVYSFDLCCGCYSDREVRHNHPISSFVDNHYLITVLRMSNEQEDEAQEKSGIEELRKIAKSHYQAGSAEVKALAINFFKAMDNDGDGEVDLPEFLSFMRQEGYALMNNPYFFKELDNDGNGTLDFWEILTLYYIIKSGRPFCNWCGEFIPGIFFSCVECFNRRESSFNLCRDCYLSTKCKHNHNGRAQFLDNYTLLEAKRDSALAQATGVSEDSTTAYWGGPVPSNAIIPAVPNPSFYVHGTTGPAYNTYHVNPPSSSHNNAIVPASKTNLWKAALTALEVGISIGSISTTLCTIL